MDILYFGEAQKQLKKPERGCVIVMGDLLGNYSIETTMGEVSCDGMYFC